jgi:heme-degrading monooxygenase HmoA
LKEITELKLKMCRLEAEKEKTEEIFKERQKMMQKESGFKGMDSKACENCLTTYLAKEEVVRELTEKERELDDLRRDLEGREKGRKEKDG